MTAVVISVGHK